MSNYFLGFNKINLLFLLVFLSQILVINSLAPIDYECDASAFYSTGEFIYNFIFSSSYEFKVGYRPPGFNFYTIISGLYLFDSFYPWIILNFILSIITFLFLNKLLNQFSKITLILGNILFIFSFIFLIHSKLFLEIHLITNLLFINIFTGYYYLKTKKIIYFYYSIILGLYLFFTRFDLVFILFFDFIFFSIILFRNSRLKFFLKHFISISFLCSLTLFMWLLAKHLFLFLTGESQYFNEKSEFLIGSFTSLNHQTGPQLLWRVNNELRQTLNTKSDKYVYNYLDKSNGIASEMLFITLSNALRDENVLDKIFKFKDKMYPLYSKYNHLSPNENFNRHYGDVKTNPDKIVNQIFSDNFESLYYPLQLQIILIEYIGRIKTDELLKKVSFEMIKSNKQIRNEIFNQFLDSFGISFRKENFLFFYHDKTINWFNIGPVNIGNCAMNTLSKNLYDEYNYEYNSKSRYNNTTSLKLYEILTKSRTLVFEISSFLMIILLILLRPKFFIWKDQLIYLLFCKYLFSVLIISIFANTLGQKYENYLMVILLSLTILLIEKLYNNLNILKK